MKEISTMELSGVSKIAQSLNWLKLRSEDEVFKEDCQKMINSIYVKYGEYLPSIK